MFSKGYFVEKVGESTYSTKSDAPLARLLTGTYGNMEAEVKKRTLYVKLRRIRYSRTTEKGFPYLETLAELGGWTSGVFGVIGLLVGWGERLHRARQRRKERKQHQEEAEVEMKARYSSDDGFSQENPHRNPAHANNSAV